MSGWESGTGKEEGGREEGTLSKIAYGGRVSSPLSMTLAYYGKLLSLTV